MARPKSSSHSNRYQGNLMMIEKLRSCGDRLPASQPLTEEQERIRRIDAQFKRQRKAQRRMREAQGRNNEQH